MIISLYFILFGQENTWDIRDPKFEFDIDLNDAKSLFSIFINVQTAFDFGRFYGFMRGFDDYFSSSLFGNLLFPIYLELVD